MHSAENLVPARATWAPWSRRSRAEVVCYPHERAAIERAARRLFGRPLSRCELAGLAGAPDGARVDVQASNGELYLDTREPLAASYRTHHTIVHVGAAPVIFAEGFHIHLRTMQGKGLGLRIFHRQVENASQLGVGRIETNAGRRSYENGYYTWPRFGFDAPLPQSVRDKLPMGLEDAWTMLDLMNCEKGRLWWKENGETIYLVFDVSARSRSRAVLKRYITERSGRVVVSGPSRARSGVAKKRP